MCGSMFAGTDEVPGEVVEVDGVKMKGYCGAPNLDALHRAQFVKISPATVQENHPHDVSIAKKAPNYSK